MFDANCTLFERLTEIYGHFQDELSRRIFLLRSLYSLTGENKYWNKFVKEMPERKQLENDGIASGYIFGCGCYGKLLHAHIKKNWIGFTDNNKNLWGEDIEGVKILPPNELPQEAYVYVAVKYYGESIKQQLIQQGLKKERIINVGEILINLDNRQYFDLPALHHVPEEVFVDVGCLNGWTTQNFIRWTGDNYRHAYCFEPDARNMVACEKNLQELIMQGKVSLINKAISNKNETVAFSSCANGCSHIGAGSMTVEAISLDSALSKEPVTFIKMDIEGAEYNALQGAEQIIRERHPKLAISVYHLPSDIFDIPALILSYYPDYKFYLRHYSPFFAETILYAV